MLLPETVLLGEGEELPSGEVDTDKEALGLKEEDKVAQPEPEEEKDELAEGLLRAEEL